MDVTDAATAPFTPENLISNIFLGDGVSIIDITYEGDPLAVGYFKDGTNAIGLDRGILLTSGRAASQNCGGGPYGADCTGNVFSSNQMNGNASDVDLNSIANGTPEDVAKYTITFQPFADTLRFRYVFASEEYPEYSCSPFNDVFGFFISGPGITGTFSNGGQNIALIPGTNTPVSINNIHPQDGTNCPAVNDQYYNSNNGIALQPVYDGYLDVFTAEAVVIPCETYTIKLVIADVSDNFYDSGVFLEAKSFGTGTIDVDAVTLSLDGVIAEGCVNGAFSFSLPTEAEQDLPLDYTIIGTAENGVDYGFIPSDLFIPQGSSSITVDIYAIYDGLAEGLESIGIDIQRDICNRDTFWIYIRDNEIVPPELGPDTTICQGDSMALDGNLPLTLPEPPSFTNDTDYFIDESGPVYSPIEVIGVQPAFLGPGVIQSVCVNIEHSFVDDLDLYLISPGGQFIELSSMNGADCDNYNNVCFAPTATTPINYVFPWPTCAFGQEPGFSNGVFQPEGVWSDFWTGEYPTNGTWQLLVLDESNGFDGLLLDWTITFEPLYQLYYSWEPTMGLSCADCPDPLAAPDETTTYVLTAWDSYGCEVYDTITIVVNEVLEAPVVNCVSVSGNSIDFEWNEIIGATGYEVSINGGPFMPPNNGQFSHTVTGLNLNEAVTIEVFATGVCGGEIGTTTCTTPNCDAPALTIENINDVKCFGDGNGLINATASGGAGDYSFTLDNSPPSTEGIFTGLSGGTYTLTVIDSWGCPNSIEVTVVEPDSMFAVLEIINNVSCFNEGDASATVHIMGGTEPYMVDWSNGQQQDTAVNLLPGSSFVFIVDANNCTDFFNFPITQPDLLELSVSTVGIGCNGTNTGSATVEIEGGVEPYFIQWDSGAGNANTATVSNLASGVYSVAVIDANGCIAVADAIINQPAGMMSSLTSTDVKCFGESSGTASAMVTGGNSPYQYQWSNGATTPDITGLPIGTFTVTITDATGCSRTDSVVVETPAELVINLSPSETLCINDPSGNVVANVTGGVPPYAYQWDNGQTTADLNNVLAGTYCLTISDANDCMAMACTDVGEPPAMVLTTVPTNAACNSPEGMIDLEVVGGNVPYQFVWSNGQTTEDATNLLPGDYSVTVTDANNCMAEIAASISEMTAIEVDFSTDAILCKGDSTGSISINASGGLGGYSYQWTGPNNFSSDEPDLDHLFAGIYSLQIEDIAGCSFETAIEVTEPEDSLALDVIAEDVSCPGSRDGAISLVATGGTPPYLYNLNGNGFFGNPNYIALQTGIYDAIVQDNHGCFYDLPDILIGEPEPFGVDLGDDRIVSYGQKIFIHPNLINIDTADFENYSYSWTSNNPNVEPNDPIWRVSSFDVFSPTTVTLVVTSESGCVEEDLLNIFVTTERAINVPTGFTPNNGGPAENNLLRVHGKSKMVANIASFQVFDRWGELLYEAFDFQVNDPDIGWDGTFKGKNMPPGVYVWYANVNYVDGISENYKGHTTLIR